MKILLIGAGSLLGNKIWQTSPKKYILIPTHFSHPTADFSLKLDITRKREVYKIFQAIQPQVVIHTSSLGDVDYCQKHQRAAWQVNVTGTQNVVAAARLIGAKCIFFSSNAVFDGKSPPYSETARMRPLNFYGLTKVAAEKIVRSLFPNSIVFRLTTMYGWPNQKERSNPATWLIERLRNHLETPVVTDVYNNHLWVGQAAAAVWKALDLNLCRQTFHIGGGNCVSRFEFALLIAKIFKLNKNLLIPVTSDYFTSLTPRPLNTCFTTVKMTRLLKINPVSITAGLMLMKQEQI